MKMSKRRVKMSADVGMTSSIKYVAVRTVVIIKLTIFQ